MRKRILAAALAAAMMLVLAACGASGSGDEPKVPPKDYGRTPGMDAVPEASAKAEPKDAKHDVPDADGVDFPDSGHASMIKDISEVADGEDDGGPARPEADPADRMRRDLKHVISAGIRYSAGVRADGGAEFSGRGYPGASDIALWSDLVSVAARGEFTLGLTSDGDVLAAAGLYAPPLDVSGWHGIVDIAAGQQFAAALRADGTVVAGGHSGYGETDIASWTDVIDIDAGWQTLAGLTSSGGILASGYKAETLLQKIAERPDAWAGVAAIACGGSTSSYDGCGHIAGLRSDGTVIAVAADEQADARYRQWDTSGWTDIIQIACGDYHTVGLRRDGTVVTTMSAAEFPDTAARIASWTDIVAVSAGYGLTLGVKADGSVVYAGFDRDGQADVSGWGPMAMPDRLPSDLAMAAVAARADR